MLPTNAPPSRAFPAAQKDAVGAAAARQLEIAALQPIIDKYQISDIDVDGGSGPP